MPLFKKCEEYVYIRELVDKGIYPYFHELESKQDIEVMMEGKRRIMLGSNNYLGLTVNQEVIDAGVEAMKKYGTGCSGSRFLNGTLDLHNKLERELADFLGTEDCVTFSTGFQSNLGIISAICGRQDYIFNDRENHASIYDGCKLSYAKVTRYRHNDMADLEKRLAETPIDAGKLIVTDGVFSMSGDICRLPDIAELAHKYKARVMVDDAHGLGVIGKGGRGTASYFGLEKEVDITMGTFSKSLASLGGYMVASAKVCEYVRHNSRPFIFSASLTPASCATARAALKVIREHPEIVERLGDLAEYYRDGLAARGVPTVKAENKRIPIIPIYTHDPENTLIMAKRAYDGGVYVNPVLPPATPMTECLLRTSYMATHTDSILDEAMDILGSILEGSK
mgnify:FL=1